MRLLVTGAAGFIGTSFVRQALGPRRADVARVVVVDALTYAGNYANLADLAGDAGFRFVHADIADAPAMAALVREERIDTLVNFSPASCRSRPRTVKSRHSAVAAPGCSGG